MSASKSLTPQHPPASSTVSSPAQETVTATMEMVGVEMCPQKSGIEHLVTSTAKVDEGSSPAVSCGVGFGRVISQKSWDTKFSKTLKTPTMFDILVFAWKPEFWMYGNWLTLGDEHGGDVVNQTRTQHGNIALISALWLTIQFSFMYSFPSQWEPIVANSYIANITTPSALSMIHEFLVSSCLTSCSTNTACCLYSVLIGHGGIEHIVGIELHD